MPARRRRPPTNFMRSTETARRCADHDERTAVPPRRRWWKNESVEVGAGYTKGPQREPFVQHYKDRRLLLPRLLFSTALFSWRLISWSLSSWWRLFSCRPFSCRPSFYQLV